MDIDAIKSKLATLQSTSNTKGPNTMNKTIKISTVHYEMLKGIMRKRGIRKEDEVIEEMIQEEYNTRRR